MLITSRRRFFSSFALSFISSCCSPSMLLLKSRIGLGGVHIEIRRGEWIRTTIRGCARVTEVDPGGLDGATTGRPTVPLTDL